MIRSTPAIWNVHRVRRLRRRRIYGVDRAHRRARLELPHRRADHGGPARCRRSALSSARPTGACTPSAWSSRERADDERRRETGWGAGFLAIVLAIVLGRRGVRLLAHPRPCCAPPRQLYRQAQAAGPERAAELYARLAEKAPALREYARLWTAEAQMPDLEATAHAAGPDRFRPREAPWPRPRTSASRARYYAGIEAPQAADEYRAALDLYDNVALRLELARHLEGQGDARRRLRRVPRPAVAAARMPSRGCAAPARTRWRSPRT